MRKKRTSRGLVLAAASTPLLLALMVTVARAEGEYDANGESMTPILCPLALPVDGMVNLLPNIPFQVPQFDPLHRSTETVPFTVSSYTYTSQVQPVTMGFGWYRPSPNTTFYGGLNWVWTGPGGGGGVLFTCNRHAYLFGAIIETVYASTGTVWGYALVNDIDQGTGTRSAGSSEGGGECYELYEYWYDGHGDYHEQVLDSWCE